MFHVPGFIDGLNLIAWLSLIPNADVFRKPRWWRSSSLIRLWFVQSLRQFKGKRMYDFSWKTYFGLKKNKLHGKENSWKSFNWAALVTDTHRFHKQQPVQSVICGPAVHAQIQFVNECCTSAARYSFSLRKMRFLRTEMFTCNRFH